MTFAPAFSQPFPRPFGGVTAAGVTTLFYDTFTGATSTAINSRAPDVDVVGGGWVVLQDTWTIQANRAAVTTIGASPFPRAVAETNKADVKLTVDVVSLSSGQFECGAIVRRSGTSFWLCELFSNGDLIRIYEYNGSVFVLRASASAVINPLNTYTMTVTASGSTISATVGAVTVSYALATANQTATQHGMWTVSTGTTSAGSAFDNFKAETL